jgi:hypothetical protein
MTATVHNHGKATISVDTGGGNTLEILGYTRNGADVTEEGFFVDVPGDENGGDAGDPIDIQYIGEMARVRLEMTKLDVAVMNKVMARLNLPGAPKSRGAIGTPGYFMFLNGAHLRGSLINTPTDPQNFLPRRPARADAAEYGRAVHDGRARIRLLQECQRSLVQLRHET